MAGPVINLADVMFDDIETDGRYTSRRALFSHSIGARKPGYNLTVTPPGKVSAYAPGERGLRHEFRAANVVDYYAGEEGTAHA